jgi:hypothetical protein
MLSIESYYSMGIKLFVVATVLCVLYRLQASEELILTMPQWDLALILGWHFTEQNVAVLMSNFSCFISI